MRFHFAVLNYGTIRTPKLPLQFISGTQHALKGNTTDAISLLSARRNRRGVIHLKISGSMSSASECKINLLQDQLLHRFCASSYSEIIVTWWLIGILSFDLNELIAKKCLWDFFLVFFFSFELM